MNTFSNEASASAERRNDVRSDMQRAHRSLGLLLAVVLALACVAVYFVYRSGKNQERAEAAENEATERLWHVSLARAKAERNNPEAGHRAAALEAVKAAAAIRPSVELRNEAIAALRSQDFETEVEWKLEPLNRGFAFDPELEHCVTRPGHALLSMRRIRDGTMVREFPRPPEVPAECRVIEYQFSATGKYLAVRYENGPLVLFERDTAVVAGIIGADARTAAWSWPPSFTADDATLCVTMQGSEGTFVLYDIATRTPRRPAQLPAKLVLRPEQNQVAVSPRGDLLAWYEGLRVYLVDATTGAVKHEIAAPAAVRTIDWDQRGDRLAFGCSNGALFLLEAASGRVLQMGGRTLQPAVQRFNAAGTLLLTSGMDGVTTLWDVAGAKVLCQSKEARGVAISRRGDRIGWGLPRGKAGVWRVAQTAADLSFQGRYTSGATLWQQDFSSDGGGALWSPPTWTGARAIELCDVEKARTAVLPLGRKASAGFLPGSRRIWMTAPDALTFHDWPDVTAMPSGGLPETGRLPLPAGLTPVMAAFSSGTRRAAVVCTSGELLVLDPDHPAEPVRMDQRVQFSAEVPGPAGASGTGALAMSPDGKWVAAGRDTEAGDPAIWDAATGKLAARLPCSAAHLCFNADGTRLATIGIQQMQIWETGTWRALWSGERPAAAAGYLGAAAFSGDGAMVAWTGDLDRIEISRPGDGTALATFHVPGLHPLTGLRFSADGARLFASGPEGKVQIIPLAALRRDHLKPLGLDWPAAAEESNSPAALVRTSPPVWLPIVLGLIPVGAAALLGIALHRRQGRLANEFMEAAELAATRERELTAARELSDLKSRFVTTVSHEFRTPLGITMSAVELLRHYEDRLPQAEKTQLFDDIHTATRNMAELMEQVLVLGRVDAGKLPYKPAPLDLDTLARKLTDESLSATNRKCPIQWNAENDLSGAHADEALLRHIFTNLVSNAVKYSPGGAPVQFRARREGLMAVFTVEDRGIGIPEADLPTLFEAFHRASNVGDIPGTGLGLVISKRCAELHGGSIQMKSKPGEGTTFTVRIPAWV